MDSITFYYTIFFILVLAYGVTAWVERSRFGAQLVAVRENEDAAKALGINAFKVKMGAICLSAAITASCGIYYVQKFLFIEPGIAFGPTKSVEALFAPIIGGLGTMPMARGDRHMMSCYAWVCGYVSWGIAHWRHYGRPSGWATVGWWCE